MVLRKSRLAATEKAPQINVPMDANPYENKVKSSPQCDEMISQLVDIIVEKYGDGNMDINVLETDFMTMIDLNEERYLNAMGIELPKDVSVVVNETGYGVTENGRERDSKSRTVLDMVDEMQHAAEVATGEILKTLRRACVNISSKPKVCVCGIIEILSGTN